MPNRGSSMLTAVSPYLLAKSSTERLENGGSAEHQVRGQKLDSSGGSQQGYDLLSEDKDKINFGPAVVSHLRTAAPGTAAVNPQPAAIVPKDLANDNGPLPLLKSPDRVSLSSNARELAYGVQSSGVAVAAAAPDAAPAIAAGNVEARAGNAGQRAYKAVRWDGPELVPSQPGVIVQPPAPDSAAVATVAAVLNATVGTEAPSGAADEIVDGKAAALSASGNVRAEIEPARIEVQNARSVAAEAASVAEAATESGESGFGESVRNFFQNLRSRLWGQAVTAYSQAPTEIVRGQRLHIQV